MTDQGETVDVAYLDFSKAFTLVCHRLLIKEMDAMGIPPQINRRGEEFLKNRIFSVNLGDHHSREGTVKIGVPQGSVLGPKSQFMYTTKSKMGSQLLLASTSSHV